MAELEQKNQQIAGAGTGVFHFLIILIALFSAKMCPYTPVAPVDYGNGIAVNFGNVESSAGNDKLVVDEDAKGTPTTEPVNPETPSTPHESKPDKPNNQNIKTSENSDAAALREEEKKKREKDAADKAERDRQAQEDAAEAQRAKALADKLKGAGGKGGKGGNRGDGTTPNGQQGSKDGVVSDQLGHGLGKVMGKLQNRGVANKCTPSGSFESEGRVVINICVNKDGKVISADFNGKQSNLIESAAVEAAKKCAREYRFKPDPLAEEEQCGQIAFDFTLK